MKTLFNQVVITSLSNIKYWAGLFLIGLLTGIFAYDLITPIFDPLFQKMLKVVGESSLVSMSTISSVIMIFTKNAFVALLCILTARIAYGLYPGMVVLFNGLVIGYLSTMLVLDGMATGIQMFAGIAPHGVFEFFGVFLACAIGFNKIPIKDKLRSSTLVWAALFLAAVVESTLSLMIMTAF